MIVSGEHIAEIVGIALLAIGACYAFAWWVASLAETPERIVDDVIELHPEAKRRATKGSSGEGTVKAARALARTKGLDRTHSEAVDKP